MPGWFWAPADGMPKYQNRRLRLDNFMNPTNSKVLVVDDDPAMLRMLCRWLEKAGYSVQVASDGLQALSMIETDCPDFVITDWEMPNMDGLQLCRRVRELNLPHYVFIMFLTVKSASQEMIAGLEIGADEFLCKPVYQEELMARLRAGSRVLELEAQAEHDGAHRSVNRVDDPAHFL